MKDLIVIKIGGVAAQKLSSEFLQQLKTWQVAGKKLIIVHGGGVVIESLMQERQLTSQKINGLRVTSKEAMFVVETALLDLVGQQLTKQFKKVNIDALQLQHHLGAVVTADFLDYETYGYVGQVTQIHPAYLQQLLADGMVPVLASLGQTLGGEYLNINADYLATAVASSLGAEELILMTDVKGVLEDEQVLPELATSQVAQKIEAGIIKGGMIPKIESAAKTVLSGVNRVLIGDNLSTGTFITEG